MIDTAAGGAVRHNDVGVPRLRIYVNDGVVDDWPNPEGPPHRPGDFEAG